MGKKIMQNRRNGTVRKIVSVLVLLIILVMGAYLAFPMARTYMRANAEVIANKNLQIEKLESEKRQLLSKNEALTRELNAKTEALNQKDASQTVTESATVSEASVAAPVLPTQSGENEMILKLQTLLDQCTLKATSKKAVRKASGVRKQKVKETLPPPVPNQHSEERIVNVINIHVPSAPVVQKRSQPKKLEKVDKFPIDKLK